MSREQSDSGSGLSIQTLLISAVGAVAAATIVPLFWAKGTVIATAMTPVVVALVSEALRKPAQRISAVAPKVTRRTATGAALRRPAPDAADTRHPESVGARGRGPERLDPDVPEGGLSADDPFGLRAAEGPRRSWWKIGLATGALAFVLGAGVVTASELAIFGGSVSGERGSTTLFSGGKSTKREAPKDATPTATPSASPSASETPTPTPSATPTPTPSPSPGATPTPPAGTEQTPVPGPTATP